MTLYEEIRAAGLEMVGKVLRATHHLDFDGIRIAKRLTVPVLGRNIVFHGETAQNAFFDFHQHEYRVNGKPLLHSVNPDELNLTPLEAEIFAARLRSRASLYIIEGALCEQDQVRFTDLLAEQRESYVVTDLSLSEGFNSNHQGALVYCRLVTVRGLTMTTGFSFTFASGHLPGLLQAYRQKTKKVSPADLSEQRFIFFYKKHRQIGKEPETANGIHGS